MRLTFNEELVSGITLGTLHNLSQLILTTTIVSIFYYHLIKINKTKNILSQLRYLKKSTEDPTASTNRM